MPSERDQSRAVHKYRLEELKKLIRYIDRKHSGRLRIQGMNDRKPLPYLVLIFRDLRLMDTWEQSPLVQKVIQKLLELNYELEPRKNTGVIMNTLGFHYKD